MSSASLANWKNHRSLSLDEIENALSHIYPRKKGGRRAQKSQSLNYSYLLLLSSEFQGFCRDIHTEGSLHISLNVAPSLSKLIENLFGKHRKVDHGNPNPANLAADFNQFGFDFWAALETSSKLNAGRRGQIDDMVLWRNAIAHQDFDPIKKKFGQLTLYLDWVQRMRQACEKLAEQIDKILGEQLTTITGKNPW
ncbi:MAG TPA: HEPN domain-containing protein [Candidatus Kapabacteria bacterium]|nr:HEPN domain-containing protein [Candidatus Kapabacteria bacterium]